MPFIPHSRADVHAMLSALNLTSIDTLFDEIPEGLRFEKFESIPEELSEMELGRVMAMRAIQDRSDLNFIGAGAYEHHIPAAVWQLASRGEFYTAYTPYQAEASQGTLQLIYEFQTMMANLMGLEVSNASMYDGASALAEAILMAVRCNRHSKSKIVLMPTTVHPAYRRVVKTLTIHQDIVLEELPFCMETGRVDLNALHAYQNKDIAALVIPAPNFFGVLEDADALTRWAHSKNIMVIGTVNPTAMALVSPPGEWGDEGADIACGDGQPLGVPLSSGGPYFGFLTCKQKFIREMPGRLVGRTVDVTGKEGFVLTLQAREQHIRRAKARSNICTNQGLVVTAATIYMSLLGAQGLKKVALVSHQRTKQLVDKLSPFRPVFTGPYFHEVVIQLSKPVERVLDDLATQGIQAGYNLSREYPGLDNGLLICVTEKKTEQDLDRLVQALKA